MVGSYQTITYNRYAVQSATKFKAKIVDIPSRGGKKSASLKKLKIVKTSNSMHSAWKKVS